MYHTVARTEAQPYAKCHLDPSGCLAALDMGRKLGGSAHYLGMGQLGFNLTQMSLGSRATSLPSGILIHPAIWPQEV